MIEDFSSFQMTSPDFWIRTLVIEGPEEMAGIVLQDVGSPIPEEPAKFLFSRHKDLIVGVLIALSERDLRLQLASPNFDRTLGDSLILRQIKQLIHKGEVVGAMVDTAQEREKTHLSIYSEGYAFDEAICDMFESIGFEPVKNPHGRLLKMEV